MIPSSAVQLGGSALLDCLLCIFLVLILRKEAQRADYATTKDTVFRLIYFATGSSILTSSLQILELVLFLTCRGTAYHIAILIIVPKIYIIYILAFTGRAGSTNLPSDEMGSIVTPDRIRVELRTVRNVAQDTEWTKAGRTEGNIDLERQACSSSSTLSMNDANR
ncbi:hypothetical protein BT69DRAFT_1279122 [Atractiella rhizophila]|nr:hypothetical protein BT69DRAFT_1279122 [Atractiella rhizophila]